MQDYPWAVFDRSSKESGIIGSLVRVDALLLTTSTATWSVSGQSLKASLLSIEKSRRSIKEAHSITRLMQMAFFPLTLNFDTCFWYQPEATY
jgi:hypothetical protein